VKKFRDELATRLSADGIGNATYYPVPAHKLPSFNLTQDLPETELATQEALSLPVHPSLSRADLKKIANAVNRHLKEMK
jgi:dTDP-4-amino-4,6-dideoxygalactose transaminase